MTVVEVGRETLTIHRTRDLATTVCGKSVGYSAAIYEPADCGRDDLPQVGCSACGVPADATVALADPEDD